MSGVWPTVRLGDVLSLQRRWLRPDANAQYVEIGVRSYGKGIFHKQPVSGLSLGEKRVLRIEPGDLVFMNIFAWEGAVAVAHQSEAGTIGSHRFVTMTARADRVHLPFLQRYFQTDDGRALLLRVSPGSAGRNRTMSIEGLLNEYVPLPPTAEQRRIVARLDALGHKSTQAAQLCRLLCTEIPRVLSAARHEQFVQLFATHSPQRLEDVADTRLGKMLSRNSSAPCNGGARQGREGAGL